MSIKYTNIVDGLPASVPFVGPEAQERTLNQIFKARIGANESVFGPSSKAVTAMQKEIIKTWQYGDPENYDLINALAIKHKVSPTNIVVGEGIDGLLGYLVRLIIQKGDNVVTTDGAYPTFNYHVNGYGGCLHKVPFKNDTEDLENLLMSIPDNHYPFVIERKYVLARKNKSDANLLKKPIVYFIQQVSGEDLIKIGYTSLPVENRLQQLKTGYPYKLKVLKTMEGTARLQQKMIKESFLENLFKPLLLPVNKALKPVKDRLDPDKTNGAYLLGVNGIVTIAHGSSSAEAVKNSIVFSNKTVESGFISKFTETISKI